MSGQKLATECVALWERILEDHGLDIGVAFKG